LATSSQSLDASVTVPIDDEAERAAVRARRRYRTKVRAWQIAIVVVVLGSWELAGRTGMVDRFFFAMPSLIAAKLHTWLTEGTVIGSLAQQVWVTLEEALLGFVIGAVLGVIAGIVLGRNRMLSDVLAVYVRVANSIPRVVLGSIFIIALGLGMASKVALAVVMVFFIVFANAFQGVREADRALIANARFLGASSLQVTTSVVIPSAMSWILASLHVSFSYALVGAVVGEFLGARQGMGLLISISQGAFDTPGVFAAMVVIAVIALLADALLTAAERRLLVWRPGVHTDRP